MMGGKFINLKYHLVEKVIFSIVGVSKLNVIVKLGVFYRRGANFS